MAVTKRQQAARWLAGDGIEIGALHNPLPVPAKARVRYVDRMPSSELRKHYPELASEELVPVSIIGDARHLEALPDGSLDFVIANHLVEHLDDPIRGLMEMTRVLRSGGVLYVALPDPRMSFDRLRELTTTEHLLAEYRDGTDATRRDHFYDWVHNVETTVEGAQRLDRRAEERRVQALMDLDYSIHFHVWRPETFLDFLLAAERVAPLELELLEFLPSRGDDNEFIFVFAKGYSDRPRAAPPSADDGDVDIFARQLAEVLATLRAVESSTSWRVTAPLRRGAAGVRRLRDVARHRRATRP